MCMNDRQRDAIIDAFGDSVINYLGYQIRFESTLHGYKCTIWTRDIPARLMQTLHYDTTLSAHTNTKRVLDEMLSSATKSIDAYMKLSYRQREKYER